MWLTIADLSQMGPLQVSPDAASKNPQGPSSLPGFTAEQTETPRKLLIASVTNALQQPATLAKDLPKAQPPLLEVQLAGLNTVPEASHEPREASLSAYISTAQAKTQSPKRESKAEEFVTVKLDQDVFAVGEAKIVKSESSKRKADVLDGSSIQAPKKSRSTDMTITQVEPNAAETSTRPIVTQDNLPIYSNTCSWLPVDGILGRAHLINVDSYLQSTGGPELKMGDVVATVLYNYSPELLHDFFAVKNKLEVSFTRKEKAVSGNLDFCIERFDTTVYVSEAGNLHHSLVNQPAQCGFLKRKGSASETDAGSNEKEKTKNANKKIETVWTDVCISSAYQKWPTKSP